MRRAATHNGKSLWVDGDTYYLEEGGLKKIITPKRAYRFFYSAHGKVHNFWWLFKEVFGLDWSKSLIEKRRRKRNG